MKTYPEYTITRKLTFFEIDNLLCGRRKATKIVAAVPGVKVLRSPKRILSWFREDTFCEFELDDIHFIIEEPFGDNSRYWIGAPEKASSDAILKIWKAFNDA